MSTHNVQKEAIGHAMHSRGSSSRDLWEDCPLLDILLNPIADDVSLFVIGGMAAVGTKGFYDIRPLAGLEFPLPVGPDDSLLPLIWAFGFPINVYVGGEYVLYIRRLQIRPRAAIGAGFIVPWLIDTDDPAYAVRRKRTIFPTGRFWVTLCTPELVYALDHGHIIKVDDCVFYDNAPIFRKFVGKFYTLRNDFRSAGVLSYEILVKYLLNSLYGKFGQKGEVWEKIGVALNEPARVEILFTTSGGGVRQIRYLLGEVWEMTGYQETYNSFPAIAAHVAAFARMYLYRLMKTAGAGNYFYCDTDSLIVNDTGLDNLRSLINDTHLGSLKIVETSSRIVIRGLKDYSTDTKTVIKGIRKNAVQISDGVYDQQRWPSLKGLLRDSETDVYTITTQRKVLQRKYTKGILRNDGSVRPFELADPLEPFLWRP